MFKMILLYSIVLFSVINVSCQKLLKTRNVPPLQQNSDAVTMNKFQDLKFKVCQLNTKYEVQNGQISDQNATLAEQGIQISVQNDQIQDLKMKIKELEEEGDQPPCTCNTVFTRWGRTDCPSGVSELVYSGITGGSPFTHKGGAAEYVCLPLDPTWNSNKQFSGPLWGYMYGTEYEQVPLTKLKDYEAPCAVCRTSQFSTVLMIPARSECFEGWQTAYRGELVSGQAQHAAASQYVCLDEDPQVIGNYTGEKHGDNGKLMYPVRARCGALPCPPYEEDALLTCVVCLK